MKYEFTDNEIILSGLGDFSLPAIFGCGQCFRWDADETGAYTGVAMGRVLRLWRDGERVVLRAREADFLLWREYFDLDTDYAAIRARVAVGDYMKRAAAFGAGIRILRQDKWEALCSFIISQNNHIPRIKAIINQLCAAFGDDLGGGHFDFPPPERLAVLTADDLAFLRAGYRAEYIIDASRRVACGEADLDAIASLPYGELLRELMKIRGVGPKVASCAALFGLRCTDAFPVDTWIKKALRERFEPGFDPAVFSPYAGVAQQYIFYYERSGNQIAGEGKIEIQ